MSLYSFHYNDSGLSASANLFTGWKDSSGFDDDSARHCLRVDPGSGPSVAHIDYGLIFLLR
jgi:hypothetical protein